MIRWGQVAVAFFAGMVAISVFAVVWNRRRVCRGEAVTDGELMLPLPDDPRWTLVECPCPDTDCPLVCLTIGQVFVANGENAFRLCAGDIDMGAMEGAERYVEAVHNAWHSRRRAGVN